MLTNKDIRVADGNIVINGDKYPLDGQSPETIMQIVKDNSDTTPTENSTAPITSGGVYTALDNLVKFKDVTLNASTSGYEAPSSTAGGVYIEALGSYEALGVDREKIIGIIPVDWSSISQPLSFYLGATAVKVMLHSTTSIYSTNVSYVKVRVVYHS